MFVIRSFVDSILPFETLIEASDLPTFRQKVREYFYFAKVKFSRDTIYISKGSDKIRLHYFTK